MRYQTKNWWRDRFITLMVIPERTRQVHKVVVPFFLLKLGVILFSLSTVFILIMAVDYFHVLGRMAENKRLKGENFKLRQELQVIRNKVESMETTVERVRNYAKKLQILTGQGEKSTGTEIPWSSSETEEIERIPAQKSGRRSQAEPPTSFDNDVQGLTGSPVKANTLAARVERLQNVSLSTETGLSRLQVYLMAQSAVIAATPSLLPIAGWVSSPYGYRRHPYDGAFRLHAGIDIAAEPGTPVRAPAEGFVIFSGNKEGYGKVLVIDHGYGIRTLFAHNSKLFVNAGVRVKRGEMISEVGSTGMSTGPHLHYEIRKNGVPVNPATFFTRSRF